jgi:hypothetical protein
VPRKRMRCLRDASHRGSIANLPGPLRVFGAGA